MTTPILTRFRDAVAAKVQETTSIKVLPGMFPGPVRNGKLGCCWGVGSREDSANVVRELMEVRVRLFLNYPAVMQPDPEVPIDTTPLEQLAFDCQRAFGDGDQALPGTWFVRLTEYEVAPELYGVELQFIGWAWNQFELVAPVDDPD